MGVLGSLGQLYMFILLVLLFMGSGLALWNFINHLINTSTSKAKLASQQANINQNKERKKVGGFIMTNNGWIKLAVLSFVGILISMAVLGFMTSGGLQGNMNNMQMGNMPMQNNMNNMNSNMQMNSMPMNMNMNGGMQMGNMPMQNNMNNMNMNGSMPMQNDPNMMMMQQLNQMQQQMMQMQQQLQQMQQMQPMNNGGGGSMPSGGGMGMM